MQKHVLPILVVLIAGLYPLASAQATVRIKDITEIEGARPNQLLGVGLVVGLDNTGGRSLFTQQMAVDMLTRFNIVSKIVSLDRLDNVYRSGNISICMVTAELGPFSRKGSRLDVTVSALDDATSLQGGTLIFTPLRGADKVDYVLAQGPLTIGGFVFTAQGGAGQQLASAQKNHPTVGRIPAGGIVEREARGEILCNGKIHLLLHQPDYDTARAIAKVINERFPESAVSLDAGTINVNVPPGSLPNLVPFVSDVGLLEVTPDAIARVVINERTGTIVAGEQVKVATVAVAHANLSIVTELNLFGGIGGGGFGPDAELRVNEQAGTVKVLPGIPRTVTVAELARALNALGVTPRDLIAILQAIKRAGALHADLVII